MPSNQSLKSSFLVPHQRVSCPATDSAGTQGAMGPLPFPQRSPTTGDTHCFYSTFNGFALPLSHLPHINLAVWLSHPRGNHNIQALGRQDGEQWLMGKGGIDKKKKMRGDKVCERERLGRKNA